MLILSLYIYTFLLVKRATVHSNPGLCLGARRSNFELKPDLDRLRYPTFPLVTVGLGLK